MIASVLAAGARPCWVSLLDKVKALPGLTYMAKVDFFNTAEELVFS
jgi:hypothetical protein